jgi:glycosyltransferase involved in cell wall biosynthesis
MKEKKIKLSVALATFNEEENLSRCLESVKDLADEMVIVDGFSTDKTVEIAKKYGAKVIVTNNPPIFHINKQKAINQGSGDWILQLDADEEITPELAREIKEIVKKGNQFSAFWVKRKNYFLGKWMKGGGMYPDPVIRFFKKGKAHLPCKSVHEQMEVKGRIGTLKNEMNHFTSPTFSHYLTHANLYTSLTAKELKEKNLKINLFNNLNYLLLKPPKTFLSLFIRHKGFLDGFPGFVWALFSGFHYPIAYIKYWEKTLKS